MRAFYAVVFAAVVFSCAELPAQEENAESSPVGMYGWVNPEIESAHISIGRLKVSYPVFNLDVGAGLDIRDYGYTAVGVWSESDLCSHYRKQRHQAFQEVDPIVLYGYRFNIAEGWSLDSRLGHQWNFMAGYRGDANRSYDEWQFKETLETPWLTLWYGMRNFYLPVTKASFVVGALKSFKLTDDWSLIPSFWMDGGSARWNSQRFGYTQDASRIGRGLNSCSARLTLSWLMTDKVSFYCSLTGYAAIDSDVREELDENPSREAKKHYAVVATGIKIGL